MELLDSIVDCGGRIMEFLESTYEWYITNVYSREEFQIAGLIFWCVVSVGLWWRNLSFTREARIIEEVQRDVCGDSSRQ